jgi:CheY-like chemotaxis protein/Tfp pilus assembly protein PilZ
MAKILVTNDADVIRALQGSFARRSDCSLLVGRTCSEIVGKAGTMRPDLIVLGAGMEDTHSIACCQRLKSDRSLREIPVVVLATDTSRDLSFRCGADEVLSFAASREQLLAAVRGRLPTIQRQAERRDVSVKVDYFAGQREGIGYTRDVSVGGLFLKTRDSFAIGDRLLMLFGLPPATEGLMIRASGNVVRSVAPDRDSQFTPGVGVQFDGLSTRDRLDVSAFVEARSGSSS